MEYGSGARKTSPEKVRGNLFALLEIHGVSQHRAEILCGLSENYFSMLKKQDMSCFPRLDKLLLICEALHVNIEDLLYKDYLAAKDQKRVRDIEDEVKRLKQEQAVISERIVRRARERRAEEEAEGRKADRNERK